MNIVSNALIQHRWLRALAQITRGSIVFIGPDGEERFFRGPQPGSDARFKIHEWSVLQRALARGDIGLGEDYIAGAWETDDIEQLVLFFLQNLNAVIGYVNGNLFNQILSVLHNRIVHRNSLSGSVRNIKSHYDVGNDFYALWLDETMTYSSALYATTDSTLAEAQRNKYDRVLSKLSVKAANILELGCGWGGFAEAAVQQDHFVTGLTISPAQHDFASRRLGSRSDIRLQDYRNVRGSFDAIVSIEMLEAVGERYWPQYFRIVADRLRTGGRAVIQTIVIRDELFAGYRRRGDFIRQYVFPGGMLPSLARLSLEAEKAGLKLGGVFPFGQHYARTLREWLFRLRSRSGDIRALGHDDAFLRNWQFYFGLCAAAFAFGRIDVVQAEFTHV